MGFGGGGDGGYVPQQIIYQPTPQVNYPTVETKVVEVPTVQNTKSVSQASKEATDLQTEKNKKAKGIAGSILTTKGKGESSSTSTGMETTDTKADKSKTLG